MESTHQALWLFFVCLFCFVSFFLGIVLLFSEPGMLGGRDLRAPFCASPPSPGQSQPFMSSVRGLSHVLFCSALHKKNFACLLPPYFSVSSLHRPMLLQNGEVREPGEEETDMCRPNLQWTFALLGSRVMVPPLTCSFPDCPPCDPMSIQCRGDTALGVLYLSFKCGYFLPRLSPLSR